MLWKRIPSTRGLCLIFHFIHAGRRFTSSFVHSGNNLAAYADARSWQYSHSRNSRTLQWYKGTDIVSVPVQGTPKTHRTNSSGSDHPVASAIVRSKDQRSQSSRGWHFSHYPLTVLGTGSIIMILRTIYSHIMATTRNRTKRQTNQSRTNVCWSSLTILKSQDSRFPL